MQAKDGLLRDLEVTHTATLEDLESRLQAEVQELTSQASASSTTIQVAAALLCCLLVQSSFLISTPHHLKPLHVR